MPRLCIWAQSGPRLSSSSSFSAIRRAPPDGSRSKIRFSKARHLLLRPVVEDAAQGEQVGLGELIDEEVAGDDVDAIRDRRGPDDLPGQRHGRGQVEDRRAELGVVPAGGDRQVAGRAAQVNEPAEPAQVEGRHDLRRAHQPVAVHPHQEFALVVVRAEEAREDRAVPAERLLPAVGPLPHRVLEVGPELPERGIRIVDVAGQPRRAALAEVRRGGRRVLVLVAAALEQLQADGGVEQPGQRVRVQRQAPRPARPPTWGRLPGCRRSPARRRRTSPWSAGTLRAGRGSRRDRAGHSRESRAGLPG